MKHPLTLIIPLALALLFISCGKKEEKIAGQVTLTFWHTMNQEEMVTLDGLVGKFMEQNPQIEIQAQVVPFSDAQNKFKTVAQAGDAPDIFRAEIAWTPEFAELGFLAPLDDYVSEEDLGDYLPGALRYNQYKDRLWGIPQVTDCLALLYNKRMLAGAGVDPPATMDDLVRVLGIRGRTHRRRQPADPHQRPGIGGRPEFLHRPARRVRRGAPGGGLRQRLR